MFESSPACQSCFVRGICRDLVKSAHALDLSHAHANKTALQNLINTILTKICARYDMSCARHAKYLDHLKKICAGNALSWQEGRITSNT